MFLRRHGFGYPFYSSILMEWSVIGFCFDETGYPTDGLKVIREKIIVLDSDSEFCLNERDQF